MIKKILLSLLILLSSIYCYAGSQKITGNLLITSGNILPSGNLNTTGNFYSIGDADNYWKNSYLSTANILNLNISTMNNTFDIGTRNYSSAYNINITYNTPSWAGISMINTGTGTNARSMFSIWNPDQIAGLDLVMYSASSNIHTWSANCGALVAESGTTGGLAVGTMGPYPLKLIQNDGIQANITSGNFGINQESPIYKLDISSSTANTNSVQDILRINSKCTTEMQNGFGTGLLFSVSDATTGNNTIGRISIFRDTWDNYGNMRFYTSSSGNMTLNADFDPTGKISFPNLRGASSAGLAALYYNTSSKEMTYDTSSLKYKTKVRDIDNTDWFYLLKPRSYSRKENISVTENGLIAEEVAFINNRLVVYKNSYPEGVTYSGSEMISAIINQIQKLKSKIDSLEQRINSLESK